MTPPSRRPAYRYKYATLFAQGHRFSVDALGSRRRLQALNRIGYNYLNLGTAVGITETQTSRIATGRTTVVYLSTANKIKALYAQLQCKPIDPSTSPYVRRSINNAIRKGYAPPFAWDDIDNPNEMPKGFEICTTEGCTSAVHARGVCSACYRRLWVRKEVA